MSCQHDPFRCLAPTLRMDDVALTREARRIQPHWSAKHSRLVPPDDRKTGDLMTPSSLTTSSVSPSPTIHDFRQSTMAEAQRREGRCIYCTNNALAYNKKLSYRRGTARCVVSIEILPIATQQCRNYLYDKS